MKHKVTSDKEFMSEIKKLDKDTDFLVDNKKVVFVVITVMTLVVCWLAYA